MKPVRLFHKLSVIACFWAAAILFSSCASMETVVLKQGYDFSRIKRVAVLPFSDPTFSQNTGSMVSQLFIKYMLREGYNVVERDKLEAILGEYQLSKSEIMNQDQIKQFKLSGIDAIITGSVTKDIAEQDLYGSDGGMRFIAAQAGITCRMVDVETGEILWAAADTYDAMNQQTAFDYLASSLVRQMAKDIRNTSAK